LRKQGECKHFAEIGGEFIHFVEAGGNMQYASLA